MDSSDSCLENTPPSIKETAENVISNLLPTKSEDRYTSRYNNFKKWCTDKKGKNIRKYTIAYFDEISESYNSSTLCRLPVDTANGSHQHKLSKIETLRAACNYITILTETLQTGQPLSLTVLQRRLSEGLSHSTANLIAKTLKVETEGLELMNSSMNDGYLEKYNCQRCVINEERLPNDSILSNRKHQHNQYLEFHVEQDIYDLNFNMFYN